MITMFAFSAVLVSSSHVPVMVEPPIQYSNVAALISEFDAISPAVGTGLYAPALNFDYLRSVMCTWRNTWLGKRRLGTCQCTAPRPFYLHVWSNVFGGFATHIPNQSLPCFLRLALGLRTPAQRSTWCREYSQVRRHRLEASATGLATPTMMEN